jgi:hypothetical protein
MARTELRRTIWGRKVQPLAFALAIATAVGALSTVVGITTALGMDGRVVQPYTDWVWVGAVLGLASGVTSVTLWVSWWARSSRWMANGMRWAAGVFSGASISLIAEGLYFSAALAACWVIAAGGAYLLEVEDADRPHDCGRENEE